MAKRWGWVLAGVVVLLAAMAGGYWWSTRDQSVQLPGGIETAVDRLRKRDKIEVASEVKGFEVGLDDAPRFEGYLERLGFWEEGGYWPEGKKRVRADYLVVELTDEVQQYEQVYHPDDPEGTVFSIGVDFDEEMKLYTLVLGTKGATNRHSHNPPTVFYKETTFRRLRICYATSILLIPCSCLFLRSPKSRLTPS